LASKARRLKARLQSLEAQTEVATQALEQVRGRVQSCEEGVASAQEATATGLGRLEEESAAIASQVQALDSRASRLDNLQAEFERLGGERLPHQDKRLDLIEETLRVLQGELEEIRGERIEQLEAGLQRLRDGVIPSAAARADVLVERLSQELEELGSLVERMLRREPLPAPAGTGDEAALAEVLDGVQPLVLEAFRGSEDEIRHRLQVHLPALRDSAPVLDLGCGRGELLLLLREADVEAAGVESDPALAQAVRRRGLRVFEGDVLAVLKDQEPASWGGVTAIHLLEHLPPATILATLGEIRRVLRPGGSLLVECPNPHTLRVGASLYWMDPTHGHPLLPETLQLYLKTSGFGSIELELLHPFPDDQRLLSETPPALPDPTPAEAELERQLEHLRQRLDELINGPRDFVLRAAKPVGREGN
jgi:O-antigen chain-terminating methyltransferase